MPSPWPVHELQMRPFKQLNWDCGVHRIDVGHLQVENVYTPSLRRPQKLRPHPQDLGAPPVPRSSLGHPQLRNLFVDSNMVVSPALPKSRFLGMRGQFECPVRRPLGSRPEKAIGCWPWGLVITLRPVSGTQGTARFRRASFGGASLFGFHVWFCRGVI